MKTTYSLYGYDLNKNLQQKPHVLFSSWCFLVDYFRFL